MDANEVEAQALHDQRKRERKELMDLRTDNDRLRAALAAAQAAGADFDSGSSNPNDAAVHGRYWHEQGFAAGIEAAAKWHDSEAERIRNLPQWGENENKMIAAIGDHEEAAEAIRALSSPASAEIGSELLSFYRRDGLTIISCGVHPLSASAPAGALETELLRNIHDADMAGVPRIRLADACQVHPQAITRWQCGYFPHEVVMRTVIEQAQRLITAPAGAPTDDQVAKAYGVYYSLWRQGGEPLPRMRAALEAVWPAGAHYRKIMDTEGLTDWKIELGEAYCWMQRKTICLPDGAPFYLFLHEVAHALAPVPENFGEGEANNYHGGNWAEQFGRLVERYYVRAPAGAQQVRWQRVNDESFEYAIQQGPHGDEFVKLLDGTCLWRAPAGAPSEKDMARLIYQMENSLQQVTWNHPFDRAKAMARGLMALFQQSTKE